MRIRPHARRTIEKLTFSVRGFRAVHVLVPNAVLDQLGSLEGIRDAEIFVCRQGIKLKAMGAPEPWSYLPAGGHWDVAFRALLAPESALFAGCRVPIYLTGMLAARVIRMLCDWRRGRGGPKREERWLDDREEFFARVRGIIEQEEDEGPTHVITRLAAQDRDLFERTFAGDDAIEAARRDYHRRMEEFESLPANTIALGRIMGMRFEFEEDDERE